MRKEIKLTAALAALLICINTSAQAPLINSGELLEKGYKLHDDGKYKEAIALYKQINRSDTNYSKALYELAYSSYADSAFEAAKDYARLGLKLFPTQASQWYLQIANAEDELKNHDSAIAYYDKVIAINKNSYINYFNKGVAYYGNKNYEQAKKSLQQCLLIYPYYSSAHYFLGVIAYEEGYPVQSMLSFITALSATPQNKYLGKTIDYLVSIANTDDRLLANVSKAKKQKNDNFELVQEILMSKIALDNKYKLQTSLSDNIIRQLQVVMEKIEYNSNDDGFWNQFYVPVYKSIFDAKLFEPFSYQVFGGLNSKQVQSYLKKNNKKIDEVIAVVVKYFDAVKGSQELMVSKRDKVDLKYLYSGGTLIGKGKWIEGAKDSKLIGPWEFFHKNGALKAKGMMSNEGNEEGEWLYYYDNGQLKEKVNYRNGKLNGKYLSWYDNGIQASAADYKDSYATGKAERWYYNGLARANEDYKESKLDGPASYYSFKGLLNSNVKYSQGKENGEFRYYHTNGKLSGITNYNNGVIEGKYKKYFYSGALQSEGSFLKGQREGTWKELYENGKLKSEETYVNGLLEGPYKEYFDNGKLSQVATYVKGKVDGKIEDFDDDGKKFSESTYDRGRLRDIKFLAKDGSEIINTTTRRGAANLTFYNPNGNKVSEGFFNKDGMRNGLTKYFYENGQLSSEQTYLEGDLHGVKKSYYINGTLSEEINYTNGEQDGYLKSYFQNKHQKSEGWVVKGLYQGEHIKYNMLGQLYNKAYYLNDEVHGYSEYYHPDGRKDYEMKYENGWVERITQFDTLGNIVEDVALPQGNGSFTFKYPNGAVYIKGNYKNNFLNGEYKIFYPDGSLSYSCYYKNGSYDSIARSYYYGGKLHYEGKYVDNNKEGEWKYYYENGTLNNVYKYKEGYLDGLTVNYNDDGTIDKEITYSKDDLEGPFRVYGDNKQLIHQLNYHNDDLVSYTYEGKDGKLVPAIPVKNGSVKLVSYYKNGTKSAEINYENSNVNGQRNFFYSTGKPYIQGTRAHGFDEGVKKVYHANGQLEKEEIFYSDKLHGLVKKYYENGKLKSEENYYLGELHGDCKYYNEQGKLKQTRVYYYDLLLQTK